MLQRLSSWPRVTLPPGLVTSLLLGIVQSILVALAPADINTIFVLLVCLVLLLYLLVPLFARLSITRKRGRLPGDSRIGLRIGLTCALLVTTASILVFALSTFNPPVAEVGGFFGLRLFGDSFLSMILLLALNLAGFLLSLIGGWVGGLFGRRWTGGARYPQEYENEQR